MTAVSAINGASDRLDAAPAQERTVTSPKRLARIAGVLYLLVGITGGFAEGFVYPKMHVAGGHGGERGGKPWTGAPGRRL